MENGLKNNYIVHDDADNTIFTVQKKLGAGGSVIMDSNGQEIGNVKCKFSLFSPKFVFYKRGEEIGSFCRKFAPGRQIVELDLCNWILSGNYTGREYKLLNEKRIPIAQVSRGHHTSYSESYAIDIRDEEHCLEALMLVIALDTDKDIRDTKNNNRRRY